MATLSTESFTLSIDAMGRLILHRDGQPDVVDVQARRAFPWSDAGRFISLRSAAGKELLLVESVVDLDEITGEILLKWLNANSFIPKITRVHEVDIRFGYQLWKVDTDRGPAEFRVQEREDIRFLHDGRFSLKDADGTVYEMTSMEKLDAASRSAVETLL